MKPMSDDELAFRIEARDAEHFLANLERIPHRVRMIIRKDEQVKYEQELRARAAKEES